MYSLDMKIADIKTIDINCDMGEWEAQEPENNPQRKESAAESDLGLMSFISSCSVACGGHIGDEHSMRTTVRNAIANGVRVGAHPAYPDKRHFGRRSLDMPLDDLATALQLQISTLKTISEEEGIELAFVKPHGALYNDMAKNTLLAKTVIQAISRIDPTLPLMGLAGSDLASHCKTQGMTFIAEAFADRRYDDNGQLVPRNIPGSTIEDVTAATAQILSIIENGSIISITGKTIPLIADTLCVHSDTEGALDQVAAINALLRRYKIRVGAT